MKQPNAHFTLLVFALLLTGCANIAERGATLSGSVGEGVERMQANQARLIHALADVQRGVLDERWEAIYARMAFGKGWFWAGSLDRCHG